MRDTWSVYVKVKEKSAAMMLGVLWSTVTLAGLLNAKGGEGEGGGGFRGDQ